MECICFGYAYSDKNGFAESIRVLDSDVSEVRYLVLVSIIAIHDNLAKCIISIMFISIICINTSPLLSKP